MEQKKSETSDESHIANPVNCKIKVWLAKELRKNIVFFALVKISFHSAISSGKIGAVSYKISLQFFWKSNCD